MTKEVHLGAALDFRSPRIFFALVALTATLIQSQAAEGDPSYYRRQGTWHATLIASREALMREEAAGAPGRPFETWVSPIVRSGDAARSVDLDVTGRDEIFLYVFGAPSVVKACATWAEPALVRNNGSIARVCHLKGMAILAPQSSVDCNLESGVSGPLRIASRTFEHGMHVYAPARIRVPLNEPFRVFKAWIGLDDWVGEHGAVRFAVTGPRGAARFDLWDILARDFTDGQARREMAWAREEGLFDDDWTPGDEVALVKRCAPANAGMTIECALAEHFRSRALREAAARADTLDTAALRSAVDDLCTRYGPRYPGGPAFRARLERLEAERHDLRQRTRRDRGEDLERAARITADVEALRQEALLAHPELAAHRVLLLRRTPHGDARRPDGTGYGLGEYLGLPRQSSKHNPGIEQPFRWDNELALLEAARPDGAVTTLYRPDRRRVINDLDLHWDAGRLLFSMPGSHDQWQVFEIGIDGRGLRQLTPADIPDVHNYDACYLPDDRVVFCSTAPMQGVPCNAGVIVGMLFAMNGDGADIRQLAFEQDHDYCPSVMPDGRILYQRWDYTDTPHVWNRMLFTMNPDGTGQAEFYGANGYWPNAVFYARPVPHQPSRVIGIVTGHHIGRVGELVIFDSGLGRKEAEGVVQRIPGRGQPVEPRIQDKLTEFSWPKFLHPFPIDEHAFLVACKPTPDDLWGIYVADVYDNLVLIKEIEGEALLEPILVRPTPRPPVIPPRSEPGRDDALVYLQDVYEGLPMRGIPRGTVKKLRLFAYHFGYQRLAGIDHRVGTDGPWEIKRVLGTVRVEEDGSALFRIPARTPLSVQPLDADGRAVQLMRSWMTAMPGENVTCVGCHDSRGGAPPPRPTLALAGEPQDIEPWMGPARGFSFRHDVQPVLDRHCVGCHDGRAEGGSEARPDLRADQGGFVVYRHGQPDPEFVRSPREDLLGRYAGVFDPAYLALRRYVRVGGLESDLRLLPAMEFHASTSELFQLLEKGHHGVRLEAGDWERFATWVDLNAPNHGSWSAVTRIPQDQIRRRGELAERFGGKVPQAVETARTPPTPVEPAGPGAAATTPPAPVCAGWPLDGDEARRLQAAGGPAIRSVELGDGRAMDLVRVPAGHFVMGDPAGAGDERPAHVVRIDRAFWIGRFEVTNEEYALFDPEHDSRFEHRSSWIFSEHYLGWPLNSAKQPVARVSWDEATAFARWLSDRTGLPFTLPTEAQWEYACRAGTASPLSYGTTDDDFSSWANLADYRIRELAREGWRPRALDLVPREDRFDDGALVSAPVGSYGPNPWGLCDMHGNVAEWTSSLYRPYPYLDGDGRNDRAARGRRVVRGGSWYDRPGRGRSAFRLGYAPHQKVFNVGFRVVCTGEPAPTRPAMATSSP